MGEKELVQREKMVFVNTHSCLLIDEPGLEIEIIANDVCSDTRWRVIYIIDDPERVVELLQACCDIHRDLMMIGFSKKIE